LKSTFIASLKQNSHRKLWEFLFYSSIFFALDRYFYFKNIFYFPLDFVRKL